MNTGPLSASLEDYLEAIYHIVHDKQAARAKDIAQRLGVNRSSVTGALHALSEKKLVHYTPYDIVTLTPEGERVAEGIAHRHDVLRDFFTRVLGVEETVAEENACRIEHAVSEDILDRLAAFIDFIQVCPRIDIRWIANTGYFCHRPGSAETCERCIEDCLQRLRKSREEDGQGSH